MMSSTLRSAVIIIMLLLQPLLASAQTTTWQLIPNESAITFTATQNNAPVTGEFKSFTGDSNFDPQHLDKSYVKITVDMNSVTTSYNQIQDTLKTADWFNVKLFPQAIFTVSHFTKSGSNIYLADGTLTLRDKTMPVKLTFTLQEYSNTKVVATGSTTIQRTQFGVGLGDWSNTDSIKDNVDVQFKVTAIKK